MSKALRSCLICGLLLGASGPAMARHTAKTEGKPELKITLRVYDYTGLEGGLLRRALEEAKIIVADAGVVVAPIICTQDDSPAICKQAPDPLNIALRIVPKPVPGNDYGTLGYASSQYITVNYSRVEKIADHADVYLDRLLACVLAHELGHVLLGPDSHSATGIMTACLTDKELGQIQTLFIGFLPFQKERMRAYVLAQTQNPMRTLAALNQR
jgi:hypothetical protein